MKFTKLLLACVLMIALLATVAQADRFVNYSIVDNGNASLTDVTVVGRVCTSNDCATLGGNISTWADGELNTGASHQIQLVYPSGLQNSNGYAIYFLKDTYIPYEINADWWGTNPDDPQIMPNYTLSRKSNCTAPVHVSVDTSNGIINATTNVQSAVNLVPNGVDSVPTGYESFYQVETDVDFFVFNRTSGALLNSQSVTLFPEYSTNATNYFTYAAAANGEYDIVVQTDPTSEQCFQSSKVVINSTTIEFDVEFFPDVNITGPSSGLTVEENTVVNFTSISSEDGAGGAALPDANMSWSSDLDGALGNGHNISLGNLSAGNHTITVTGTNGFGHTDSEQVAVNIVAAAAPVITLISPADNAVITNTTAIDFIFNATDFTAIANCSLLINGGINQTNTSVHAESNMFSIDPMAYGTYQWGIGCADIFANSATSANRTLTVAYLPDINITSPVNDTTHEQGSVVNFTSISLENIAGGAALPEANITWSSDIDGVIGTGHNISLGNLSAGNHTITANGTNIFGLSDVDHVTVNIEASAPPTITIFNPVNNTLTNVTTLDFNYTVSDFTGVNSCSIYLDAAVNQTNAGANFTITGLTEGIHFWAINCSDTLGNNNQTFNRTFTIDTIAPLYLGETATPASPTTYTPGGTYNFTMNWTDLNGITNVGMIFDNVIRTIINNTPVFRVELTDLAAGNYSYQWNATDAAGNTNTTGIFNYTIDKAASVVNLSLNGTDGNITVEVGDLVNMTANLTAGETTNMTIYQNGSILQSGASPLTNLSVFPALGFFNITAIAPETQNYTGSSEMHFVTVQDTTAPQYAALAVDPASPTTYAPGQTYNFTINWTDNLALDDVFFEYNNATNMTPSSAGGNAYYVNLSDLQGGTHNFRWYANDTSNNLNLTAIQSYVINPAASEVNLLINGSDSDMFIDINETVNLTGHIITPAAGDIDLYINGTLAESGAAPQINISDIWPATETINVTVFFDGNANYSPSFETHYLFVNGTPPIFNIDPTNASIVNLSFIDMTFDTLDPTTCRWSFTDEAHATMTNDFVAAPNSTSHNGTITGLTTPYGFKSIHLGCVGDTALNNTDLLYNLTNIFDNTALLGTNVLVNNTMTNATIQDSNLTEVIGNLSTINNSALTSCTVVNSTVKDIVASGCTFINTTVDPSNLTGSNVSGGEIYRSNVTYSTSTDSYINDSSVNGSTVLDTTILNSTVENGTFTNSTINLSIINDSIITDSTITNVTMNDSVVDNSTLINTTVVMANVSDGTLYSGWITLPNGTVYNASSDGQIPLTETVNYAPVVGFTASPSAGVNAGQQITFTSTATDANVPGTGYLGDALTHFWDFGDGTNATSANTTKTYGTANTYTVVYTVTDAFGKNDTMNMSFTILPTGGGGSGGGGGGGGGGGSAATVTDILLSTTPITAELTRGSSVRFLYAGENHTVTLNDLSFRSHVNISVESEQQNATIWQNETKKFDIDGDVITYDLAVKLVDTFSTQATLELWLVNEPTGESKPETEPETEPEVDDEEEDVIVPEDTRLGITAAEYLNKTVKDLNVTVDVEDEQEPMPVPGWVITVIIVMIGLAVYFLVKKIIA